MNVLLKLFTSLLFCLILLNPQSASALSVSDSANLSPYWNWQTLESENFKVTYADGLSDFSQKALEHLEHAHTILSPLLKWQPRQKTQVLVIDNEDAANGFALAALRVGMVLRATPPDAWFSTAYYDDWIKLLTFHEYTHILNMDPTTDWMEVLRLVFGDVIRPNSLWSPWMLEGLAVYFETRLTQMGRGRSPYYEMILRAAVEKNKLTDEDFISLDRINGKNPYSPGGETIYLYGYQLMNELAQLKKGKINGGDEKLGTLSLNSSHRVPFFINDGLKNVTEKDWYQIWDAWIEKTNFRMQAQLATLRTEPQTSFQPLTNARFSALGATVSPDDQWLAYTEDSLERRTGLFLKNLKTNESIRIRDKLMGVGMSFTPDSKTLIFSELNQQSQFYLQSDLWAYDLNTKKITQLTSKQRARDPAISPDGQFVLFTLTQYSTVGLAQAKLIQRAGNTQLGPIEVLYMPPLFGRVASPKWHPTQKKAVFSVHFNEKSSQEIYQIDLVTRKTEALVSNQKINRDPTFHPNGELYFVSDLTRVDNLFRLNSSQKTEQVTNLSTGLWLPTFSKQGVLYASVYTLNGWEVSRVELAPKPIDSTKVTLPPPPAPAPLPEALKLAPPFTEAPHPYQPLSTLWPRQWSPIANLIAGSQTGLALGGQILGFDAVDRHQYSLGAGYLTETKTLDSFLSYTNQSLGPSISLQAEKLTSSFTPDYMNRNTTLGVTVSFPFRKTWSRLTPFFNFQFEELKSIARTSNGTLDQNTDYRQNPLRSSSLGATYSDVEGARLGITSEGGRMIELAGRAYWSDLAPSFKVFSSYREFIELWEHSVLIPRLSLSTTSHFSSYRTANTILRGRYSGTLLNTNPQEGLSRLALRGYPAQEFFTRTAAVSSLDFIFPLAWFFRGWGTNPFFAQNLSGFLFGESTFVPRAHAKSLLSLPSFGGGLRLSSLVLLHLPVTLSLEIHQGLKSALGGTTDFFVGLTTQEIEY